MDYLERHQDFVAVQERQNVRRARRQQMLVMFAIAVALAIMSGPLWRHHTVPLSASAPSSLTGRIAASESTGAEPQRTVAEYQVGLSLTNAVPSFAVSIQNNLYIDIWQGCGDMIVDNADDVDLRLTHGEERANGEMDSTLSCDIKTWVTTPSVVSDIGQHATANESSDPSLDDQIDPRSLILRIVSVDEPWYISSRWSGFSDDVPCA